MTTLRHRSSAQAGEGHTLSTSESEETTVGAIGSNEAKWGQLSKSDRQKALEDFFQRWDEPANDRSGCLSEADVLRAINEPDPAKQSPHLAECNRCYELVDMGNPQRVRIPINEILAESSRKAAEAERGSAGRSFTPWAYVTTFYKSYSLGQRAFVAAVLLFFLVVAVVPYVKRLSRPSNSFQVVELSEDKLWTAEEWLGKVTTIAGNSTVSPQERIRRLQPFKKDESQINKTIAALNKSVNETQRAELGTLVARCQDQLRILSQLNGSPNNVNAQHEDLQFVATTTPSRIVTQVWAVFSETSPNADPQDVSTAMARIDAAKNVGVTSISETGQVVVYDRVSNRSDAKKKELDARLNELLNGRVQVNRAPQEISSSPHADAASPPTAKVQ